MSSCDRCALYPCQADTDSECSMLRVIEAYRANEAKLRECLYDLAESAWIVWPHLSHAYDEDCAFMEAVKNAKRVLEDLGK